MSRVFIDTNVLIYRDQRNSAFHDDARDALRQWGDGHDLWISRQILREYLATMTRPGPSGVPPLDRMQALTAIADFQDVFFVADDDARVTQHLTGLMRTIPVGGKQVHDANIVATMAAYDITTLLTFNVADFRRFHRTIHVVRPGPESASQKTASHGDPNAL